MRKEENIGHVVRGERVITSLLLECKTSTVCQFIIYQGKQKKA